MKIVVDDKAGYCFGVKNAIMQAEAMLDEKDTLFSLGHIVHNQEEVNRLSSMGLKVIQHDEFEQLRNQKVLIRAHGEPPSTYDTAYRNHITLIDATCPIVKHLQRSIQERNKMAQETNCQIVIYGKRDHPEVIGLAGQTEGQALVVITDADIDKIDPAKDVHLYAQTTMNPDGFDQMAAKIDKYLERHSTGNKSKVFRHNTICRQVSNRIGHLQKFAAAYQIVLFVSGKESSNGRFLFSVCRKANPNSYHIENENDIDPAWLANRETIGITGATSTPPRQLKSIAGHVARMSG